MEKKTEFFKKVANLFDTYNRVLVANLDKVGSSQLQTIRKATMGKAVIMVGKNTLLRKAMRIHAAKMPAIEALIPQIWGNIALIFTKDDLTKLKDLVTSFKIAAPAKPGSISPILVVVPKGNTGLDPSKTSFFQALNIATKIVKSQIEIINDITIVNVGDKVGVSEAALLSLLNIHPFSYGVTIVNVYDDGNVFEPAILDITNDDILQKFSQGVSRVASFSLGLHFPTLASFPHLFSDSYKNILAVSIATDYTFKQAQSIKQMIDNPQAFVAPVAVSVPATTSAPSKEEPKEKEEDEDDFGGGMSLFGDD